jgi:hypothetical protein
MTQHTASNTRRQKEPYNEELAESTCTRTTVNTYHKTTGCRCCDKDSNSVHAACKSVVG